MLLLLIFSISGLFLLNNIYTTIFSLTAFSGLILILIIFFNKKLFERFKKLICRITKSKKIQSLLNDFGDFYSTNNSNNYKLFVFIAIAIIGWIIAILQSYLMLIFLDTKISFFLVFSRVPIGILITLIPLSFGGLGTREAAFLFLFQGVIIPEKILIFTLLFYITRILFPGLVGIFSVVSIRKKKSNVINN